MASSTTTSPSPLRADAARNRERILSAARELLAERGEAVEMTDIASAAGVGVGTLYRRFPEKDDLLRELLREKFRELASALEQEFAHEDRTARERLDNFIRASAAIQGRHRGLHEAMSGTGDDNQAIARSTPGLHESMVRLADDAIKEGSVRADLEWEDIVMCTCSLGHVLQHQSSLPGSWERLLAIQLAGLDPR